MFHKYVWFLLGDFPKYHTEGNILWGQKYRKKMKGLSPFFFFILFNRTNFCNYWYLINFSFNMLKGNSNATLGEDIADNDGFKEVLLAYRDYVSLHGPEPLLPTLENYTHEQILTLSFANVNYTLCLFGYKY